MHPIVRVACIAGLLLAGGHARADDRARTERLEDFDAFCRFVARDRALQVVLDGRQGRGEGIAIGLNAARGVPVFGAPRAGLLAALAERRLDHAGVVVPIRAERLR